MLFRSTGLPTSLAWKLPPGWKAGEILWPAPMVLRDSRGNIVGNGYEGDLLLPVTLTPPADLAPGGRVELKAAADWLMCEEVCIPGGAEVSLSLPVAAAAPAPNAEWGERIRGVLARLPRADADWTVAGSRNGGLVNVEIRPAARSGAAHSPEDLHLFSVDGLVAYDLPQRVEHRPDGSISITVKVDPAAPADAKRLVGVVTARNGWKADGSLPGLAIDVAFAAPAAAAAQPASNAATGKSAAAPASLAGTLLLAFLGGLILKDRKSTRLNSSHSQQSRMPSSA